LVDVGILDGLGEMLHLVDSDDGLGRRAELASRLVLPELLQIRAEVAGSELGSSLGELR
jgi:hypothetical protein